MTDRDIGLDTLVEALLEQRFRPVDEFGLFVTYGRADEPLKVHVGPDGAFAAFDGDDQVVAEGKGTQDLYAILIRKTVIAGRSSVPSRRRSRSGVRTEGVTA
jgi:hypothetical protein